MAEYITINRSFGDDHPLSEKEKEGLLILIRNLLLHKRLSSRDFDKGLSHFSIDIFGNSDKTSILLDSGSKYHQPFDKLKVFNGPSLEYISKKILEALFYSNGKFTISEYEKAEEMFCNFTSRRSNIFYNLINKQQELGEQYSPKFRYMKRRTRGFDTNKKKGISWLHSGAGKTWLGKPILKALKDDFNYVVGLENISSFIKPGKANMTTLTFRERGIEIRIQYSFLNVERFGVLYKDILDYVAIDKSSPRAGSTLTIDSFSHIGESTSIVLKCRNIDFVAGVMAELLSRGVIMNYEKSLKNPLPLNF